MSSYSFTCILYVSCICVSSYSCAWCTPGSYQCGPSNRPGSICSEGENVFSIECFCYLFVWEHFCCFFVCFRIFFLFVCLFGNIGFFFVWEWFCCLFCRWECFALCLFVWECLFENACAIVCLRMVLHNVCTILKWHRKVWRKQTKLKLFLGLKHLKKICSWKYQF